MPIAPLAVTTGASRRDKSDKIWYKRIKKHKETWVEDIFVMFCGEPLMQPLIDEWVHASGRQARLTSAAPVIKTDGGMPQGVASHILNWKVNGGKQDIK